MSDLDVDFEKQCGEYLNYLYMTANIRYGDIDDLDSLVQETMLAFLMKLRRGETICHPKAFLAATLHHKYNDWLREKYRSQIITCDFFDQISDDDCDDGVLQSEEYAAVRKALGRLIRIYREVAVRYYMYGRSVDEIAAELGISKGTVMSRLSNARGQMKEGLQAMEKYTQISYAPKSVSIGIWGSGGLSGEPFSLIRSPLEANLLVLAYEKPISVKEIANAMGMPCAYIEPIAETLVKGELLGRTGGGLIYTRCYMQRYEDSFGDVLVQETLADQYAERVWAIAWKHLQPLTEREVFLQMTEKQKATMILFSIHQALLKCTVKSKPSFAGEPKEPPERPNGGRWLATATVYENGQRRDNKYESSGPVWVNHRVAGDDKNLCQMFDCQSLLGDAHWAYSGFKYRVSLQTVLRFYASLLPCDVKPDNNMIYELIPEFEHLHILRRDENGEIALDIPALPFEEAEIWAPVLSAMTKEMHMLLKDELARLWQARKNKVPKHIDCPEYFMHASALGAYHTAQLAAIVQKNLMPYRAEIGKTPLIYLAYRKK